MGYRNDEAVVIDARIEHKTPKAILVELETDGRMMWLPLSQVYFMGEPIDGVREIHISNWIAGKNGL